MARMRRKALLSHVSLREISNLESKLRLVVSRPDVFDERLHAVALVLGALSRFRTVLKIIA